MKKQNKNKLITLYCGNSIEFIDPDNIQNVHNYIDENNEFNIYINFFNKEPCKEICFGKEKESVVIKDCNITFREFPVKIKKHLKQIIKDGFRKIKEAEEKAKEKAKKELETEKSCWEKLAEALTSKAHEK